VTRICRAAPTGWIFVCAALAHLPAQLVEAHSHDLLPAISMVIPYLVQQPTPLPLPPNAISMPRPWRPAVLPALYASFATLQVLDVHSTRRATSRGYVELNPLMQPTSDNVGAMLAIKVGATAGTIFAVEKLWRHNRTAAVLTMIGVNAGYALLVSSNYRRGG
jgi:hypothetical protein